MFIACPITLFVSVFLVVAKNGKAMQNKGVKSLPFPQAQ
jgi:hypothetical protein